MHASIRRYEGLDASRINEVTGKVNETLIPRLRELPGFSGYYLIEGGGILSSLALFETSEQADKLTMLVSQWITDEKLDGAMLNAPKITSGEVVARSDRALTVA